MCQVNIYDRFASEMRRSDSRTAPSGSGGAGLSYADIPVDKPRAIAGSQGSIFSDLRILLKSVQFTADGISFESCP